jgi:hypothetical protein
MVHPVCSYCMDVLRCTVNRTLKKGLLGYDAEQYCGKDKIFRDIHSIPSSDLMKTSVLSSLSMGSKRYPETSYHSYNITPRQ